MRKIPKKAILSKPEPIIIKILPDELRNGIQLPKVKYEISAVVESEQVFHGMVLPIPKVLVFFLSKQELMLIATIMEETNENGECAKTVKELAAILKVSAPTLSATLYNLRNMGLLQEAPNGKRGAGRTRSINYKALQHLNDLLEGESVGVYSRIRKATRKTEITSLTKEDIKNAYDHSIVDPDADEAESEEYD